MHRVPPFLPRRKASRRMPQMPWSARHGARRVRSISLFKTRSQRQRAVDVEVPHVSTGKGRYNSRNSRRRGHAAQTSEIIPALSKSPGQKRDPEPNWNLQGPRRLSRGHTPLPTKCQKAGLSLRGKRRLILCSLLANGWNPLQSLSSNRC